MWLNTHKPPVLDLDLHGNTRPQTALAQATCGYAYAPGHRRVLAFACQQTPTLSNSRFQANVPYIPAHLPARHCSQLSVHAPELPAQAQMRLMLLFQIVCRYLKAGTARLTCMQADPVSNGILCSCRLTCSASGCCCWLMTTGLPGFRMPALAAAMLCSVPPNAAACSKPVACKAATAQVLPHAFG